MAMRRAKVTHLCRATSPGLSHTARVMGHPDDPEILARADGGDDGDNATTRDIEWIDENGTHHSGDTRPEPRMSTG